MVLLMVPPTILFDGLMSTISFSDILRLNSEDFSRSRKLEIIMSWLGIAGSLVSSKLSDGTDVEVVEDEDVVEDVDVVDLVEVESIMFWLGIPGSLVSSKLSDSRSDVTMSLEHLAVSGISFPQIKG